MYLHDVVTVCTYLKRQHGILTADAEFHPSTGIGLTDVSILYLRAPPRLSSLFLTHYVPKCQMSSGPCGPIILNDTVFIQLYLHQSFPQATQVFVLFHTCADTDMYCCE